MNIAKVIEARMRKGWSQGTLAEKVGVGLATIQRWEAGKGEPQGRNRLRLGEELRLTQEEILGIEIAELAHLPVASPQEAATKALQDLVTQDLTLHLWSLASQSHWTCRQVHRAMARILKDHETMNHKNHHISRRKALLRLIALPLATLGAATFLGEESLEPAKAKEVLMQCAVGIGACWELRKSTERSDLLKAFDAVSTYLPTLQRIVKDFSEHRQEAAGLVAQCFLFKSLFAHHIKDLSRAINYAQHALTYSKEACDLSLQLRALESLTLKYAYSRRNQQALQTIEQAIPLLKQKNVPISSQIQALVYGSLACNAARNGQDGTAYLDQAGTFVAELDDKQIVYLSYEQSFLLFDTGVMYYQQGATTKALEAFSQLVDPETLTLKTSLDRGEIGRIEAINYMTMASLRSEDKNMEQALHFLTEGIQAARALQSEQRFAEALAAYDIMRALWPNEKRILALRDLTEHW